MSVDHLLIGIGCICGLIAVGLLGYVIGRDQALRDLGLDPDEDLF